MSVLRIGPKNKILPHPLVYPIWALPPPAQNIDAEDIGSVHSGQCVVKGCTSLSQANNYTTRATLTMNV
jgi:hypothetical protein